MERIERYPIKNRLILMIMSTTVLSLFIVGSVLVVFDQYQTKQGMIAQLTTLGRIIADRSTAALSFDDPKAATDILSALSKEPSVLCACTYDRSHNLFASFSSGKAVACPTEIQKDGHRFTDAYLHLYQSVSLEGETIGTIYLQATLRDLHARLVRFIFIVLSIVLLASIVAYILANKQQALISTPILRLADIAKRISSGGNYVIQMPSGTGDEIGTLYHAFKNMLEQIDHRDKARDQAEQLRRESEAQVRLLLDSTAEAIYGLDLEGKCTFVNPACVRMLGYENATAFLGKNLHSMIHYAHADGLPYPEEQCGIFKAFKTGSQCHNDSEVLWRSDGTSFQAEYWSYPIYKESQKVGCVVTFIEITERKEAENERKKLIHELETKNAEMERFTYTVSHDLKSPLITILGFLGLLEKDREKEDTERMREDITQIKNSAEKMQQLLNELLELSRVGRVVASNEKIRLDELAKEATALIGSQFAKHAIKIQVSPDLPVVLGDRNRLLEVLQNLIDNAVKFMGDQNEPRIEIGIMQLAEEDVYYVRDNGMGIDGRYQEKVFGLFERLDEKSDGTGIGLAITKRIIEVHGGRIWVESEGQGQGSTFCFTLSKEGVFANDRT